MSASKCARCDKTVYPVEGLRCLDKIWHKGCFKCHECSMTLNMKNYKGFEKRPYCNAHCPQAKATTVADTPEIRRLAENTRIQSQAKYHEDFEKSKGKNFTTIADDPETRRIKETSKIISNASYHGDIEKKKHMEEKRGMSGQDEMPLTRNNSSSSSMASNNNLPSNINNNSNKHQNRMQSNNNHQNYDHHDMASAHQAQQQQRLIQQQQQQQLLLKQQQQQQYIQPVMNRQSSILIEKQQQLAPRNVQQQPYSTNPNHQQQIQLQLHQQQQQQMLMRQQQEQQQIIMQQHRQSMDASIPMSRQVSKQAIIASTDYPIMKNSNMSRGQPPQALQQQLKYMPLNDPMNGQPLPHQLVGVPPHMLNQISAGGGGGGGGGGMQLPNNRRMGPNSHPPGPHQQATQQHLPMMHGYNPHPVGSMNGIASKHPAHISSMQQAQHLTQHSDHQIHSQQRLQMRPASLAGQPMQPLPHQVPRRVFRAMYDYIANDVDEVSFLENDILIDCVNVDRNWLIGKVARSGQTGMLPANYVELLPSQ